MNRARCSGGSLSSRFGGRSRIWCGSYRRKTGGFGAGRLPLCSPPVKHLRHVRSDSYDGVELHVARGKYPFSARETLGSRVVPRAWPFYGPGDIRPGGHGVRGPRFGWQPPQAQRHRAPAPGTARPANRARRVDSRWPRQRYRPMWEFKVFPQARIPGRSPVQLFPQVVVLGSPGARRSGQVVADASAASRPIATMFLCELCCSTLFPGEQCVYLPLWSEKVQCHEQRASFRGARGRSDPTSDPWKTG